MLNLINIGSAVATHRNLVDPIQRMNMRGLMAERFRAFDLRMEGYWFDSRRIIFFILFFPFIFYFCLIFFRLIFQYYPLSFLQLEGSRENTHSKGEDTGQHTEIAMA
jgi:hypothetical protein